MILCIRSSYCSNSMYLLAALFSDIDDCLENPCQNGGQCEDKVNHYVCSCQPGWTGNNCQTSEWSFEQLFQAV